MRYNNTEVADMIGVSRESLEKYCRGERNPSYPVAKNLITVLGGTLDIWLDGRQYEIRARLLQRFKTGE